MKEEKQAELNKLIKELKNENAALRNLAVQISLTDEREKIKIAARIHDGICQNLVLGNINLARLMLSTQSDELKKSLKEIQEIIKGSIGDARLLIFELSPPSLGHIGLEATLEELSSRIAGKFQISVSFSGDGQSNNLNEDTRILLFNMVRELLTNIVKHAQAREVIVSSNKIGQTLRITVTDDGVGFDPHILDSEKCRGWGLFKIREQISQMGGSLEIESSHSGGTKVTLFTPLGL